MSGAESWRLERIRRMRELEAEIMGGNWSAVELGMGGRERLD